jgi:two-component system response regulator HydG
MDDEASILIVDDDAGMCETLADIVEAKGYRTSVAFGGYEAIEKARETDFDVILMDIRMPGMNGVETFKRIKDIQPDAAVVMMTAYAVEDLIVEALRQGAYSVLYKPLDVEKMIALIDATKEGRRVLVVDDDRDSCEFFKDILEARGYQVGIASRGEEAIEMARDNGYDMVFIDTKLPKVNGLEAHIAIKESNPQAVAVMMAAYPQEVDDLSEEPLGGDVHSYLHKPFEIEEVIQLVDGISRRKRWRGEQETAPSAGFV